MTSQEIRVHANNQCVHFAKVRSALNAKDIDVKKIEASSRHDQSDVDKAVLAHGDILESLLAPYHKDDNPNGLPSAQDAIDSLKPEDE